MRTYTKSVAVKNKKLRRVLAFRDLFVVVNLFPPPNIAYKDRTRWGSEQKPVATEMKRAIYASGRTKRSGLNNSNEAGIQTVARKGCDAALKAY